MAVRTTTRTVIFTRPFAIAGIDHALPAGSYEVETDEELLDGMSIPAYKRVLTVIHLHADSGLPGTTQSVTIDPHELDAALQRDRAPGGEAIADIPRGTDPA